MADKLDADAWTVLIFGYLVGAIIIASSVGALTDRHAYGYLTLGGLCLTGVILLYCGLRRESS